MIITLNKETNMRLMKMDDNAYLVSMCGEAKMIIDTILQNEDVLLKFTIKDNCRLEEFVQICLELQAKGAETANRIADRTLTKVMKKVGFVIP